MHAVSRKEGFYLIAETPSGLTVYLANKFVGAGTCKNIWELRNSTESALAHILICGTGCHVRRIPRLQRKTISTFHMQGMNGKKL